MKLLNIQIKHPNCKGSPERSRMACHERSRMACHERSRMACHERSRMGLTPYQYL